MTEAPTSVEEVRKLVDDMGIEFLFAQFVEMYGKPNAKLVPATHLEDVFAEGAGFAGFATGELGQGPHDPDIAAMPDPASFTPVPWQPNLARFACDVFVEGEPWPYCPRTILKRHSRRAAEPGLRVQDRDGGGVLPDPLREDGTIEVADPLDILDRPCYDMKALTRQFDFISTLSKYETQLGLGQLRERPRGRERAVRVELPVRGRPDDRRPDHLLPLHGPHARAAAGLAGDVHAEAVREPHRQRPPLHMSIWDEETDTNLFEDENDPRGLGTLRARRTTSSAGCCSTRAPTSASPPRR